MKVNVTSSSLVSSFWHGLLKNLTFVNPHDWRLGLKVKAH
jgi:hypothetical protein